MELAEIRRKNALSIMRENALDELSFALCLGLDESQLVGLLEQGGKKIGDSLARVMEQTFSKPHLWMDQADGQQQGPKYDLFG